QYDRRVVKGLPSSAARSSTSDDPEVAMITGGLMGTPKFHLKRISGDYSICAFEIFVPGTRISCLLKNRVNFYFDEHAVVNQAPHFDHGRARPNLAEKLAVSPPELFPPRDVCDEHPRPHNILQPRAQSGE